MRRLFLYGALTGAIVLFALSASAWRSSEPQAATKTVSVDVQCQGERVSFTVDPWTVHVDSGGEADWSLTSNSTATTIDVAPKRGRWPFAGNPSQGRKGVPARSGGRANQRRGTRHSYNITVQCSAGQVVIDPDIIID